jgi:hypothetical protein
MSLVQHAVCKLKAEGSRWTCTTSESMAAVIFIPPKRALNEEVSSRESLAMGRKVILLQAAPFH